MLHRSIGFPVVILRPFFIFGPGQDKGKFLPWAIEQAMLGHEISMTKGEQTRDPIWVTDVAGLFIMACIKESAIGEVINIASGSSVSLAEIVGVISATVGNGKFKLGNLPYRHGEIMRSEADITKLNELFGSISAITINEGIRKLVNGESM